MSVTEATVAAVDAKSDAHLGTSSGFIPSRFGNKEYGHAITGRALQDRLGPELVAEIHQISRDVFGRSESRSPNQIVSSLERVS
jgi:hypothetical protein